jgi:pyruvate dehydrogenase E2 component (dihydrolipoamide acetyltransferase)
MATGTAVDVVMPQMGVSVSEGTVTRWLKNVGDSVQADETLLEISTDKVDTEVPSPGTGVLQEILVQEGETVEVGTVLARIGSAATAPEEPAEPEPAAAEPEVVAQPRPAIVPPLPVELAQPAVEEAADEDEDENQVEEEVEDEVEEVSASEPAPAAPSPAGNGTTERHGFVSPVVARIAAEHDVDPTTVPGTGTGGRVTKKDILAFVERKEPAAPVPAAPAPSPPPSPAVAAPAATAPAPARPEPPRAAPADELEAGETLEPMTAMRRGIAEHMRRSLDTAAHVTSAIEVDMSKVAALREHLKDEYRASYGVNPTYLAFIARATIDTLRDWPLVNAEIRGESIVTRKHANLGFAVALDGGKGLIVPVLKHAEGLNLLGMARGIADLAERARTKKLLPDDVQGGTFTITNPGGYGTFMGTPIINQPQTAILGTYAIVKRPWVITDDAGMDAIAIRPMMNLTLTYDHRLVDGAYGAQVLRDLAVRLQSWGESDY